VKLRVAKSAVADLDEIWAYVARKQNTDATERLINELQTGFPFSLRIPA